MYSDPEPGTLADCLDCRLEAMVVGHHRNCDEIPRSQHSNVARSQSALIPTSSATTTIGRRSGTQDPRPHEGGRLRGEQTDLARANPLQHAAGDRGTQVELGISAGALENVRNISGVAGAWARQTVSQCYLLCQLAGGRAAPSCFSSASSAPLFSGWGHSPPPPPCFRLQWNRLLTRDCRDV